MVWCLVWCCVRCCAVGGCCVGAVWVLSKDKVQRFGVWFGAKLSKGAKQTSKGLVLGAVFGAV